MHLNCNMQIFILGLPLIVSIAVIGFLVLTILGVILFHCFSNRNNETQGTGKLDTYVFSPHFMINGIPLAHFFSHLFEVSQLILYKR